MVIYVTFLRDVARQKLIKSANVSRSYSQNNTGTVFLRHGVGQVFNSVARLNGSKSSTNSENAFLLHMEFDLLPVVSLLT